LKTFNEIFLENGSYETIWIYRRVLR